MNDKMNESLSALVDGETDELEVRRVMNQIDQTSEMLQTWRRYQLIGSVLRNEPASTIDLSRGIMQALDGEPMDDVVTPVSTASNLEVSASALDVKSSRWSWLASGAVAASVTLAVLVGVRATSELQNSALNGQALSAVMPTVLGLDTTGSSDAIAEALVSVEPISDIAIAATERQPQADSETLREAQNVLKEYVLQHTEHASLNTASGMMPYARVANFEQDAAKAKGK
ncbi:sigma-E factor negative regulatory protein [Thalassolituus sp.]|jgi:sigma-E factor negative regulatory protein RseA|uniref:sigma-E factor negative regulatory protein n=1 Tax=Thalassolituus sp. TaxID=2030822 RepID=UPI002A81B163|nr:sigma-E factor negative regulatory protein [Thalassolituus sp.]